MIARTRTFYLLFACMLALPMESPAAQLRTEFPLREAYERLFDGDYVNAIQEAEKVIEVHREPPTLTVRSVDIIVRSLVFLGKEKEALQKLAAFAKEFENDNRPYSAECSVPLSLILKVRAAANKKFIYRRSGQYAEALEAVKEQIALLGKACEFLQGEQKSRERFHLEVVLESELGDMLRHDEKYELAVRHYQTALDRLHERYMDHFAVTTKDLAQPIGRVLLARLPHLIECCGDDADKRAPIKYARNVDFGLEVGDWHRDLGRRYQSGDDLKRAREKYKECGRFLASHDPSELDASLRERYRLLKEKALPERIEEVERLLAASRE